MRKLFFIAFTVLLLWPYAPPAQAGIVEFFFPSLRKPKYDPSLTLKAPFADKPASEEEKAKDVEILDQAHRNNHEVADWAVTALSEALTFDQEDTASTIQGAKKYFQQEGWAQYTAFLEESGLNKVLQSKKYMVRSFARETPLLLNEGAVEERYRWLYEVPIMISYMKRDVRNYKNVEPVNQELVVTVQLGRVKTGEGVDSILIERWSAKIQKLTKK